jgi:hypothetical protein
MKVWTVLIRGEAEPVLVREGFSWGALLFGPLWLAFHRAWIPAALSLVAWVLVLVLTREPVAGVLGTGLAIFLGLTGFDLVRWSLETRGYLLTRVLIAHNQTDAWGSLLAARPELAGRMFPAGSVR